LDAGQIPEQVISVLEQRGFERDLATAFVRELLNARAGRSTAANWQSLPDYYEILQVSPNADIEVIQAAYKRLAFKNHPDRNLDPAADQRMRLLNEAYEKLSDPAKRQAYDYARKVASTTTAGSQQPQTSHPQPPTADLPPGTIAVFDFNYYKWKVIANAVFFSTTALSGALGALFNRKPENVAFVGEVSASTFNVILAIGSAFLGLMALFFVVESVLVTKRSARIVFTLDALIVPVEPTSVDQKAIPFVDVRDIAIDPNSFLGFGGHVELQLTDGNKFRIKKDWLSGRAFKELVVLLAQKTGITIVQF